MRIEHAAVYVRDLESVRVFFETYFGATSNSLYHNSKTNFQSYFLSFAEGARLEIMTKPGLVEGPESEFFGYAHLALSLGSKEAVDQLTQQLHAAGYATLNGPRTTGDGYYESVVAGPENLTLELTL